MRIRLFCALASYSILLAFWLCGISQTEAQEYDVVILNGRVMDPETDFDEVANIGIQGGWITKITKDPISGKQTINATGHVVAAGFIDTEQHGLTDWGIKVNLRDGVTTQMDFEVGALNISQWYAKRDGKLQANFGTVVGQEFSRMRVHDGLKLEGPDVSMPFFFDFRAEAAKDGVDGWSVTRSTTEQMNKISATLDEGLREGALGVGSTIGYAQHGITTYEMLEAQRAAARYGRLTAVHHRFHPSASTPTEGPTGANEIIVNAMLLDAPLQIHHNNDYGWWEIEEKTQLAREKGYNIWSTWYPWDAGSGNAGASILAPATWETSMGYKYEETIYDPQNDKYLTKDEFLKLAKEDPGYMLVAFSPPRKEWLKEWIKLPHFVVAGDGMPTVNSKGEQLTWDSPFEDYAGHPRSSGSHAKVLRLGREANVPLMHTLSQLSYWTAKHLGDTGIKAMQVRGRMQEGKIADIVVFDPQTVKENSEYAAGKNGLPSSGLPHVLVFGQIVVSDSKVLKGVTPGQPIRFAVEEKGRFVPATKEMWLKTFTIDSGGVAPRKNAAPNLPASEDQSKLTPKQNLSEQFWWGDHQRLNDFAGYCCEYHQLQARFAAMEQRRTLSPQE
ncbi:amidohydrolase family protein [Novipirellula herctigrandis]